jgi:hypothetical protein
MSVYLGQLGFKFQRLGMNPFLRLFWGQLLLIMPAARLIGKMAGIVRDGADRETLIDGCARWRVSGLTLGSVKG